MDFGDGEWTGRTVDAVEGDGGGGDVGERGVEGRGFFVELLGDGGAAEGPELEVDEGAFGMDFVGDLPATSITL